jgi:uncharacterized RDD family membrane protein YckC
MQMVNVSTPFNIHLDFEIAPLYKRLVAWLVDIFIRILYAYAIRQVMILWFFSEGNYPVGVDMLVVSMPILLYPLLLEVAYNGRTPGKMLMGIRVLSLEGGEPDLGQYLTRWIFRVWEWPLVFGMLAFSTWGLIGQFIVCCFLGIPVLITIAVTTRHQRLGDLAAGTAMVDLRKQFSIKDTIFQEVNTNNYQVMYPEVMRLSDRDINALKTVLTQTRKTGRYETAHRIAAKVKEVLRIDTRLEVLDFLEKLLNDYNYLATRGENDN